MNLDADMIFTVSCRIQGMDWSRQAQLVRDKWKSDVLDAAMNAHAEAQQQGLEGSEAQEIHDRIRDVSEAVGRDDEAGARKSVEDLKRVQQEQAEAARDAQADIVDWRITLQNILALARANLDPVKPFLQVIIINLPPDAKAAFETYVGWEKAAQAALEAGDDIRGRLLAKEAVVKLLSVPLAGNLALSQILINHQEISGTITGHLKVAREQVFEAIRRNDGLAFNRSFEDFKKALQDAMIQLEKAGAPPEIKVLLGKV